MIRLAAVGDVHFERGSRGCTAGYLGEILAQSDALLIAGDLTHHGHVDEAKVLAEDLAGSKVPVVAVLGNPDYHLGHEAEITKALEDAGVTVLEGNSVVLKVRDTEVGIAGIK